MVESLCNNVAINDSNVRYVQAKYNRYSNEGGNNGGRIEASEEHYWLMCTLSERTRLVEYVARIRAIRNADIVLVLKPEGKGITCDTWEDGTKTNLERIPRVGLV